MADYAMMEQSATEIFDEWTAWLRFIATICYNFGFCKFLQSKNQSILCFLSV